MKPKYMTFVLLLSTLSSHASDQACNDDRMLQTAILHSLITKTYGERIAHSGGLYQHSDAGSQLIADMVSESGRREIQIVTCDEATSEIQIGSSSIRPGRVIFDAKRDR